MICCPADRAFSDTRAHIRAWTLGRAGSCRTGTSLEGHRDLVARLFISYARKDGREFSDHLCRDLDARGHETWLDRSDITGGLSWTREIEKAVDETDAMLAILTEAYHDSRVADMELARAHRKQKRLIPLRVDAAADPPLLLETAQYVDFTDPNRYDASLAALIDAVAALPAGTAVEPPRPRALDWAAVRTAAGAQAARFIREKQGTAKNPGSFIPDLYVRRESVASALDAFLAGDASALVLVGEAGVGKTTVVCRWTLDLLEGGHGVLAYDCGALADTQIEREIARDLSLANEDALRPAIEQIDRQAADEGRALVIVFDGVNDYQGSEREGVQVLLKRINALAARLPGRGVRIVVTCSTTAWNRLDRLGPIRLDWSRYFSGQDGEPLVRLGAFSAAEFAAAYPRYQQLFGLATPLDALPPALADRLRDPVLLRMMAEAYRGQPLAAVNLALGIYRRFFEERVRLPRDELFVDELAGEMLRRQTSSLAVADLARHEHLGPDVLSEETSCTYYRLLERGVLQESRADPRAGAAIRFSYPRVAAYALAVHLRKAAPDDTATVAALVDQASQFPLAWETGKTVLLLCKTDQVFVALAESVDLERRELAAEALVELAADEPRTAERLLGLLLDRASEQARRTALKAAYNIGPQARPIFLHAAIDGAPDLRQSVKDTLYLIWLNESPAARRKTTDALYLIWRSAPGFTYEFLDDLLDRIGLKNLPKLGSILEFVLDLSITIYINHCEQPEVIERTARLYHDLAIRRLHLDLLNTGILGPAFEKLIFRAVARVFSERILSWMLFGDLEPARALFELPREQRACLARMADALDPAADLAAVRPDLVMMLQSERPIFNGAAALAVAVHACHDFSRIDPLARGLFEELTPQGRLWLLLAFAVLLPDTPPEWTALLERFTERYVTDHLDAFRDAPQSILAGFDIVLVPLGLAYGKAGSAMPLFETLIRDGRTRDDTRIVARLVGALGPVGFHYPAPVFDVLQRTLDGLGDGEVQEALVSTLATMRTLHFDAVDRFLNRLDAPEPFRRRVDAAADVDRVHRYIHVLGYYNNAVHYTLHYPRMRRQLSMGALKLLAEARGPQQFVADYTATAVRMFREAGFQLLEWTRPE